MDGDQGGHLQHPGPPGEAESLGTRHKSAALGQGLPLLLSTTALLGMQTVACSRATDYQSFNTPSKASDGQRKCALAATSCPRWLPSMPWYAAGLLLPLLLPPQCLHVPAAHTVQLAPGQHVLGPLSSALPAGRQFANTCQVAQPRAAPATPLSSALCPARRPPHPSQPPLQTGWANAVLAGFIMAAASSWLLIFSLPQQLRVEERRREQRGALAKEIQL